MKRCSRCGQENKDESRFCQNCGAELSVSNSANILERFKSSNKFVKIIVIVIVVYLILWTIGMIPHIFFGVPLDSYSEEADVRHLEDFNAIDMDCDGALTFDEADGYAPDIGEDELSEIFDEADKNHNGYLKGGEFDNYVYTIEKHYKDLEKQKKADEQAAKKKSSSNLVPTVKLGKCPSCGSDASYMYDYYDEFGRPYYQCSVCDYWTYDEGEFYEG
ncbi:MAG: zinc-ribbon domain-containing protein [Methanobrevibacter sp.]|uniref:zinc-ribbon domain-containing protein n=1 Tax=Methanobrevibacter sp. TaxID=66852 RepID=UPI001B44ABCD|nr:zinc-ribbon domain-containing protein [Methanobrevibacter sp.]MBP3791224.1 zinc-ribbon domain-containing protein [Methanobrevibacter sp.]